MNTISIKKIEPEDVEDFSVYNIEIESKEVKDDLYYKDIESGIIHHNCLRKDWGLINESFPQTDLFLQAYKINEFYPIEPVHTLKNEIKNNKIGVLGYTMKANTDDTRDSLVPKMIRYINRYVPESIKVSEPNLELNKTIDDTFNNYSFYNYEYEKVIEECNIIFIAVNHKKYNNLKKEDFKNKIVVDIWGVLGENQINYFGEHLESKTMGRV